MSGLAFVPFGALLAVAVFIAACAVTAWGLVRATWKPVLAAASLFAILVEYGVIGLTRANLPGDFANRSRYVYIAAFFIVLAVVDWIPNLRAWAGEDRSRRALVGGGLAAVLIASLAANAIDMRHNQRLANDHADRTRAAIEFDLSPEAFAPWVDPAARLPGMPDIARTRAIVAASGSPLTDALFPMVAPAPSARARESTLLLMLGSNFRVERSSGGGAAVTPDVVDVVDVRSTLRDGCLVLDQAGPKAAITLKAPPGSRVRLTSDSTVEGTAALGLEWPPSRTVAVDASPTAPVDVLLPAGAVWTLRLDLSSASGSVTVCQVAAG
jgi:hypothetical protein